MICKIRIHFKENWMFYIVTLAFFVFHCMIYPQGDDLTRINSYKSINYMDMINRDVIEYSKNVSCRYFIYFIVNTLLYIDYGYWIWRVLDCLVILSIMKNISYLLVDNKSLNMLMAMLMCMYPFYEMSTAGALSTTIGYLWVVAALFVSFALIKKALIKSLKWWEYVIFILVVLYSTNHEQICIVSHFIYLPLIIYGYYNKNKKLSAFCLTAEIINVINTLIIFALSSANRSGEASTLFKDFGMLSYIHKFEIAYSTTLDWIFFNYGIFWIFICFLAFCIFKKSNLLFDKIIAIIPAILISLGYCNIGIFTHISNFINSEVSTSSKYGIIYTNNYFNLTGYIQLFIMSLIAGTTIICVALACDSIKDKILSIYILLIGAATRIILMFTPNVIISSYRTYVFAWFSLISVFIYIANINYNSVIVPYLNKHDNRILKIILPIIMIIIAAFCFKNNAFEFLKNLSKLANN